MPFDLNATVIILWMAVACVIFLLGTVFSRQLGAVFRFLLQCLCGCAGIWALNTILLTLGLNSGIGINPLSAGIIGVLGFPGFMTLFFAGFIL